MVSIHYINSQLSLAQERRAEIRDLYDPKWSYMPRGLEAVFTELARPFDKLRIHGGSPEEMLRTATLIGTALEALKFEALRAHLMYGQGFNRTGNEPCFLNSHLLNGSMSYEQANHDLEGMYSVSITADIIERDKAEELIGAAEEELLGVYEDMAAFGGIGSMIVQKTQDIKKWV